MSTIISVRINNPHGLTLLQELEAVGVITLEKAEKSAKKSFNGKRFRGIVPPEEAEKLTQHIETIRNEWERDI